MNYPMNESFFEIKENIELNFENYRHINKVNAINFNLTTPKTGRSIIKENRQYWAKRYTFRWIVGWLSKFQFR